MFLWIIKLFLASIAIFVIFFSHPSLPLNKLGGGGEEGGREVRKN